MKSKNRVNKGQNVNLSNYHFTSKEEIVQLTIAEIKQLKRIILNNVKAEIQKKCSEREVIHGASYRRQRYVKYNCS